MSGNPFRRSVAPQAAAQRPREPAARLAEHDSSPSNVPTQPRSKPKKVVRITSPPRSPPALSSPISDPLVRDRSSTPPPANFGTRSALDAAGYGIGDQERNTTTTVPSEAFETGHMPALADQPRTQPPGNPFARTLAHIEPESASTNANIDRHVPGVGRGALDVDAFKRLLLTGTPGPNVSSMHPQKQLDGTSSTDASSLSQQSIFEHAPETVQESPRSSYELSDTSSDGDDQDENSNLMGRAGISGRKAKPPIPRHRHGKHITPPGPQTVSFDTFSPTTLDESPRPTELPSEPLTPSGITPPSPILVRSPSDLNKPLPPPPTSSASSAESGPMSPVSPVIQGTDASTEGSVPETPSDGPLKKTPPPPPVSRRHSQYKSNMSSGRARSSSSLTQPSLQEDTTDEAASSTTPQTESSRPLPPPPRRPGNGPAVNAATQGAVSSSKVSPEATLDPTPGTRTPQIAPPPPPTRTPGRINLARTPSMQSASSSGQRRVSPSVSQGPPPPPPPRRSEAKRSSIDGVADSRRASMESAKSATGSARFGAGPVRDEHAVQATSNILEDMSAFQEEIERLRKQALRRAS